MKYILLSCGFLAVASSAIAQSKFDADATLKKLAPFIDQNTVLVSRLDLQQFDPTSLLPLIDPLLSHDAEDKAAMRNTLKALRDGLIHSGIREIYVVAATTDYPHIPCLLVPIGESPPERKDLFELLKAALGPVELSWTNIHGFLCVGEKSSLERLRARKPDLRPDITDALSGVGDGAIQTIFAPSADMRKIFEEVAPSLPSEVGGGSIQTFTRGLKWLGLSVGPTPKTKSRLVVQAVDADAAIKIQMTLLKGFESAKSVFREADDREKLAYLKLYDRIVELLTPRVEKDRLVAEIEIATVLPDLTRQLKELQPAARVVSSNNLKQIALALHNFESVYARFPANIRSKDDKPLLSWRVAILPYIEQNQLYQQFKLDEPWDSEHNKKLIAQMPKIFMSPKQNPELRSHTTYLAPLGKGLMWEDPKGERIADVLDGTSNTILVVEANDENAVIWTKPDDIAIDMKHPTHGLLGHWDKAFMTVFADGHTELISKDYSGIWALFTKAGGEVPPKR